MNAAFILSVLLTELAFGMYALVLFLPMEDLGKYFFKFHAMLFLWLSAVSLVFRFYGGGRGAFAVAGMLSWALFLAGAAALRWKWGQGKRSFPLEAFALAAGGAGVVFDGTETLALLAPTGQTRWLAAVSFPVETLLLGSVMLAIDRKSVV